MATTFLLTVAVDARREQAARQTLAEAHGEINRLEDELTEFRSHSPVYQLNQSRPGERIAVPASVCDLLERAERLKTATRGAFDCLAKGPAGTRIGWEGDCAWREGPAHLSFGAIGKGFALDAIRLILEREGFSDYFLSAGGSSLVLCGRADPSEPWRWGWSWSKDAEGNLLGVRLRHDSGRPMAIGVSGLQEKGAHLVDPVTRQPASTCQSALVGHARATEADALSTALFVGGWEAPEAWEWDWNGVPPLALMDHQGVPHWNQGFQKLWGSLDRFC
jgi:thiamine biosynthesis lipoprotein